MRVDLSSLAAALGLGRRAAEPLVCDSVLRLTAHHSLHAVRLGARRWVIACHPGGVAVVDQQCASEDQPAVRAAGAGG